MLELLTRHTVLCADETSSICQTLPLLVLWGNTVRSIHIHLNDPQGLYEECGACSTQDYGASFFCPLRSLLSHSRLWRRVCNCHGMLSLSVHTALSFMGSFQLRGTL